jgi:hypothetical protein
MYYWKRKMMDLPVALPGWMLRGEYEEMSRDLRGEDLAYILWV